MPFLVYLPTINPLLPFTLAGFLAFGGLSNAEGTGTSGRRKCAVEQEDEVDEVRSPESVVNLLQVDPIEFEFGYGLIPLADTNQGGDLLDRVIMIRRQICLRIRYCCSCDPYTR